MWVGREGRTRKRKNQGTVPVHSADLFFPYNFPMVFPSTVFHLLFFYSLSLSFKIPVYLPQSFIPRFYFTLALFPTRCFPSVFPSSVLVH